MNVNSFAPILLYLIYTQQNIKFTFFLEFSRYLLYTCFLHFITNIIILVLSIIKIVWKQAQITMYIKTCALLSNQNNKENGYKSCA